MTKGRFLRGAILAVAVAALVVSFFPLDQFRERANQRLSHRPAEKRVPAGGNDLIFGGAELVAGEIYKTIRWTAQLPVKLALPIVVRSKLGGFVDNLPLQPDVRTRVTAKIKSDELMDRIVPFLFYLKKQYMRDDSGGGEKGEEKFDAKFRSRFSPTDRIPGVEHSMFHWKSPETTTASDNSGFRIDPGLIADMVAFYDAVFLQGKDSPWDTEPHRDPEASARALPIIRSLLNKVADKADPKGEISEGIRGVLKDAARLETLSITLVDFLTLTVYKNYQMFAKFAIREQELQTWMDQELAKGADGKIWDYLKKAQDGRHYAMHVVVDGLQGHLMEALSRGQANDPFIQSTLAFHHDAESLRPSGTQFKPAPPQQTEFLEEFGKNGFKNANYLSFFRQLYESNSNGIAQFGVATTPTISVRSLPIAKTGAPVAGAGATGIPNFHFVDRPTDRAYYFFGNDALLLDPLTRQAGMRTLFERLNGFSGMNCNAQYDRGSLYSLDAMLNLAVGEKSRDFGDFICIEELEKRADNELNLRRLRQKLLGKEKIISGHSIVGFMNRMVQKALAKRLIEKIARLEDEGFPQYLLYYNPWPDHFAHFKGPYSDEIISPSGELNRLDYWLTRATEAYKKAGVYSKTLFGMAGDHGLVPVFFLVDPEVEVFERLRSRGIAFISHKISSDEGEGPKMTNPIHPPSMKGNDVIVASTAGGNYMMDFFLDQGARWTTQPLYSDLTRLRTLGGATLDIVDEILRGLGDTLDYLVVREEKSDLSGGIVRVIGPRSGSRSQALIAREGNRVFYKSEKDLLGVAQLSGLEADAATSDERTELLDHCVRRANARDPSSWCAEHEWRVLTSYSAKPDSVVQLSHLYDTDRAGTINLFPRKGIGYNSKVPGRHAGELFAEKDAFVGLWGEPVTATRRPRSAVNGSLPITIFEYLSGTSTVQGQEGWGYESLSPKVFGKQ